MPFTEDFLDQLRASVRVSEIVGRKFHLRKQGHEFVAVEDQSLTVNDTKRMWFDFGKGDDGGDIFKFLEVHEGMSFIEAVERIAQIAGIRIPGAQPVATQKNGKDHARSVGAGAAHAAAGGGKREVVATYDYTDAAGRFLYQVARFQFRAPDGSWERYKDGKIKKSIAQRRRSPEGDDTWVWGLEFVGPDGDPIEFMRRGAGNAWSRYDEKSFAEWHYQDRRSFAASGNVTHSLYHLPEILDELSQERSEQRTICIPEGEAKVDLLRSWGVLATCNSGGAGHFTTQLADMLRGAADIVLLEDNDEASRKRTAAVAPMLLDRDCRVRSMSFADYWPACPPKGDIVDWAAAGGGTAERLLEIVDKLPEWEPPPYQSRYGARVWGQQRDTTRPQYQWAIKGIIPARENIIIMGPSGSGKSFETLDMALSVAEGAEFAGRRVLQMGVVYCCYEAGAGMDNRVLAYELGQKTKASDLPFAWLTRPPGIYASEENATGLADEIVKLTERWSVPVGVIVVDTHNAATRGSSEVKSEDISRIAERYGIIQNRTRAGLWIVGHTNGDGEHRGNNQLYNGIETCLKIEKVTDGWGKDAKMLRDDNGRVIRRVTVKKQREGEDGLTWDFVLQPVEVGRDADGDAVTSMISVEPRKPPSADVEEQRIQSATVGGAAKPWDGRYNLSPAEVSFFKALLRAIDDYGVLPPAELGLPMSVSRVVTWHNLADIYRSVVPNDEEKTPDGKRRYNNRIATAMRRAREALNIRIKSPVVGVMEVKSADGQSAEHYLWPTGRPVKGAGLLWPARMPDQLKPEPVPIDQATGQEITEIDPNLF